MHPATLLVHLSALVRVCVAATSTCRPVHYILDSLPQQCPTSSAQLPCVLGARTGDVESIESSTVSAGLDTTLPLSNSSTASPSTTNSTVPDSTDPASSPPPDAIESSASPVQSAISDSPTADEGFLSFEEWKRLNLARAPSPDDHSTNQLREAPHPRDHPEDQAVDSLGDEIDFQLSSSTYGKTSKERFNYASFDCAAAVLKANPEAKGSSSILGENRDRYMLNKCGAPQKFVIVEMCEDILVDTVVLANFEFFSSTFKEVRVSVSDRYPVAERGWKVLGTFVGRNTREIQVFAVDNPLIWARYLRLEFLSHYGSEFYCPLTLLRIHGTTMMEEYKNQDKQPGEYRQERSVVKVENVVESIVTNGTSESVASSDGASTEATGSTMSGSSFRSPRVKMRDDVSSSSNISSATQAAENRTETLAANSSTQVDFNLNTSINTTNLENNSTLTSTESPPSTESKATESPSTNHAPEKPEAPPSISPITQESVYKQITKRISLLEANATLSLRYIEEQSQLLRDVFSKMERRHTQKLDSFIQDLNATLISRMQHFRVQYEQLWQSTIVELESQKESSREEIIAMSARLSLLADELIFQKRMSIAHSVMLLVTLLFILTTRGVRLDLPRLNPPPLHSLASPVQSPHLHRSHSAFLHRTPQSEPPRTPDVDGEKFLKIADFRHLSPEREVMRSVSASPPSLARQWRSPTPSNLRGFLAVAQSDTEGETDGTEEELLVGDAGEDYATPAPSQQEFCD